MDSSTIRSSHTSPVEAAVDVLHEIFVIFTPEGEMVEWNRRLNEKSGYADTEIARMQPSDFVHEEEAEFIREKIAEVLREGHARFETRLRTKEGDLIPYEVTAAIIESDENKLLCGAARDISRRKQAQKERDSTERRFRRLFESVPVGVVITTPDGEVLEANPTAMETFGYEPEEIPDLNVTDLYVDPGDRERLVTELEKEGEISGEEVRFRRADGKEIICEISAAMGPGEEGDPEIFKISFRDVTERKRAQEALEESEEKFRKLAEGAEIGIALLQEGVYVYVNPALANLTGYTREKLLGRSPEFLVHPSDWPRVQEQVEKRLTDEVEDVRYETRVVTKSEEIRYVSVSGSRITYQGRPATIATVLDVTEERRLRREILMIQEQERKYLGRELHDGLAGELSAAMMMLGRLCDEAAETSPTLSPRIGRVREIVEEATSSVRNLTHGLDPAGLSEGDLLLALESLAEDTENVWFETEGLQNGDRDLPLGKEGSTHLYRIVQEAVNNARRHAEASEIVVRLRRENSILLLEIEDDGCGFASGSREAKGSLGLRSMQHRAEVLDAELQIDSEPNKGTRISCRVRL